MAAFPPSSSSSSSHDDQVNCYYYYSSSNLHFHSQSQTLQDIIKLPPNTINTINDDPNLITAHVPIANSSSSDSMLTHYCNLHPTTTAEENFPTLSPTRKRKSKSNSNPNPTILQSLPQGKGKNSKKMKECEEKKIVKSHKKEEKKIAPDGYIHVRAKRGQATDSHSLAERVRREKISERMRVLQALVPGCDKVIGKALMLEEIINYVQSLQNQVEILSMKLASVDPMFYCASAMDLDTLPDQNLNNSSSMGAISLSAAALDQNPHFVNINSADHVSHIIPLPHPPIFPNHLSQVLWEGDGQPQETINDSDIFCNLFSSLI